eukprot:6212296-Pleurochrysis_carterae.AAC.3
MDSAYRCALLRRAAQTVHSRQCWARAQCSKKEVQREALYQLTSGLYSSDVLSTSNGSAGQRLSSRLQQLGEACESLLPRVRRQVRRVRSSLDVALRTQRAQNEARVVNKALQQARRVAALRATRTPRLDGCCACFAIDIHARARVHARARAHGDARTRPAHAVARTHARSSPRMHARRLARSGRHAEKLIRSRMDKCARTRAYLRCIAKEGPLKFAQMHTKH